MPRCDSARLSSGQESGERGEGPARTAGKQRDGQPERRVRHASVHGNHRGNAGRVDTYRRPGAAPARRVRLGGRPGDEGVRRARRRDCDCEERFRRLRQGIRHTDHRTERTGVRPNDVRHRLGVQGVHRGLARHAGRRGQGPVGRARHPVPARVPDVRHVRFTRAHCTRLADAPQRSRARRPPVVRHGVESRRNRPARALPEADL